MSFDKHTPRFVAFPDSNLVLCYNATQRDRDRVRRDTKLNCVDPTTEVLQYYPSQDRMTNMVNAAYLHTGIILKQDVTHFSVTPCNSKMLKVNQWHSVVIASAMKDWLSIINLHVGPKVIWSIGVAKENCKAPKNIQLPIELLPIIL